MVQVLQNCINVVVVVFALAQDVNEALSDPLHLNTPYCLIISVISLTLLKFHPGRKAQVLLIADPASFSGACLSSISTRGLIHTAGEKAPLSQEPISIYS